MVVVVLIKQHLTPKRSWIMEKSPRKVGMHSCVPKFTPVMAKASIFLVVGDGFLWIVV